MIDRSQRKESTSSSTPPSASPSAPPSPSAPTEKSRSERWAAASIFALAALKFALRDNMTSNELSTLLPARQLVDPTFLPGDWYLKLKDAPRIPFGLLLAPLNATLPLIAVSIIGRLLCILLLSAALARVATRLRIGLPAALLIGGLYIWLDQSVAFGEWMFGQVESKVVAYALVWFGLDALMARSLRRAALLFGLATTLHILVGGWASLALGMAVLWLRIGAPRDRAIALAVWLAAAAVGLSIALSALVEPSASTGGVDVSWIYVYLRNPHHVDPLSVSPPLRQLIAAPILLAALFLVRRLEPDREEPCVLAAFAQMSLVPCAFGLVAAVIPGGHRFLQLIPFRVGSVMLVMVGLCVLVPALLRRLPERARRPVPLAGAAAVAVLAGISFVTSLDGLRAFPEGGRLSGPWSQARSFAEACAWIRDHTEPGSVVLAAPSQESVGYLSRRPVAVLFKDMPSSKPTIAEWYRRMVAFNGGLFKTRGYKVIGEVDENFQRHSRETYRALAAAYNGRYLLVRRRLDLDLPEVFHNADWSVFDLGSQEPVGVPLLPQVR